MRSSARAKSDARLQGRRVLVTGAASGIGYELASLAVRSGAEATLVDLHADAFTEFGARADCRCYAMDVADPDAWAELSAPETGWDFVALNAGVMTAPPDAPADASNLLTMEMSQYRRVMDVNVDGVVHGVRRVAPDLAAGGAIAVTASAAGLVGYGQDIAYSMTKHAVVGLVRGLAQHFARKKQDHRICAICPGGVRTGIVPAAFQGMALMEPEWIAREIVELWLHGENGEVKAKMRPETPAQRIDEPELPPWW